MLCSTGLPAAWVLFSVCGWVCGGGVGACVSCWCWSLKCFHCVCLSVCGVVM